MLAIFPYLLSTAVLFRSVAGVPAEILPVTGESTQTTGGAVGNGECPTGNTGTPKCYRYASDFPPESSWISLDCLISRGRADMVSHSKDGPDEADNVISAVQSVAGQAGIDA
ncbi:MAG: hypothetical protein Q9184_007815, partial [Pyrenodesmia sp. 2 TL-2023]